MISEDCYEFGAEAELCGSLKYGKELVLRSSLCAKEEVFFCRLLQSDCATRAGTNQEAQDFEISL